MKINTFFVRASVCDAVESICIGSSRIFFLSVCSFIYVAPLFRFFFCCHKILFASTKLLPLACAGLCCGVHAPNSFQTFKSGRIVLVSCDYFILAFFAFVLSWLPMVSFGVVSLGVKIYLNVKLIKLSRTSVEN